MEYSTKITEKLVKSVLPDFGKIVTNFIWNSKNKGDFKNLDTGGFKCIF